ncbi:staygreen family protein [Cytobacillus oceanisediminis]|uniref:staygreen family protein n=1 Tax=Cytobacillus oceanisediminis TaxID=665099 RepID=UPI00207A4F2C|nr:staygreen family protein [Cytobacillus oceanisediminis]USK46693.1 staygreen family protein [Cytobacillus oceanisediminis]
MSNFNPSKLSVKYLSPATEFRPVDSRKYTLTHSDATGELFLAIGECYDFNAVNPKFRDEAFAEWIPQMGQYVLSGRVYISGGEFDQQYAKIRFLIFQKELDLALTAMVYGDRCFFTNYPWLLDSPIFIYFESVYPEFSKLLYYGTPRKYLSAALQPV